MNSFYALCAVVLLSWSGIARAGSDDVDYSFDAGDVSFFGDGVGGKVSSVAIQQNGKILIGGYFAKVNGLYSLHLARLNADGSLDTSFISSVNGLISLIVIQPDGKILISGNFTTVGGQTRNKIARLNKNGSLDTSFNAYVNGFVSSIVIQQNDQIMIGGAFTSIANVAQNYIARLNTNGSLDTSFNNPNYPDSLPQHVGNSTGGLALQPDGKILVGTNFYYEDEVIVRKLERRNSNGSLDAEFAVNSSSRRSFAILPDGKILFTDYSTVDGVFQRNMSRLNSDGSFDTSFQYETLGPAIQDFVVQRDEKILILRYLSGATYHISQLNADGSLVQSGINVTVIGAVRDFAIQPDGNILIAGAFISLEGITRHRIARLLEVRKDFCFPIKSISGRISLICL